jgi:hypothetical protein
MARSLLPFTVCPLGSCHKVRASSTVSQFPSLMPSFLAPFTRSGGRDRRPRDTSLARLD